MTPNSRPAPVTRPNPGLLALAASLAACELEPPPDQPEPPPLIDAALGEGYPTPSEPCGDPLARGELAPTHLVVTSTDFNTGAVGLVDLTSRTVAADLAPASSDAVPVVADGRVFVLNRFGFDYVDELDPAAGLALIHEFPILAATSEASANPQALSLDPSGAAWISLLGAGELQRFEFPTLAAAQPHASAAVDLRGFADADGIPELGAVVGCGELAFVAAQRIDRGDWVPVDETLLIPIARGEQPSLFDWDPDRPGADAIGLGEAGFGRWRIDPSDASGRTILALGSGLARVDLAAGTHEWVVEPELFEAAGYERLQLASFAVDAGGRIWISAATEGFAEHQLVRVDLDGPGPSLAVAVTGLQSVTGAVEIVADELWFADTTIGASGLRVFAVTDDALDELPDSPLPVGLPPMAIAPL